MKYVSLNLWRLIAVSAGILAISCKPAWAGRRLGSCLAAKLDAIGYNYEIRDFGGSIPRKMLANARSPIPEIGTQWLISKKKSNFEVGDYLYLGKRSAPYRVTDQGEDESVFQLRRVNGAGFVVKREPKEDGSAVLTRVGGPVEAGFQFPYDREVIEHTQSLFKTDWKKAVSPELLTRLQIGGSETFNSEFKPAEVRQNEAQVLQANADMLRLLRSGRSLTITDLRRWHLPATASKELSVIRGSERLIRNGDQVELIVKISERVGIIDDQDRILYWFLRPSEVPSALSQVVAEVNRLGSHSSIVDAAQLYQRYITIHPFGNGNGRTSRILMHYMLGKLSIRPARFTLGMRDILFQPPERVAALVLKSMQDQSKFGSN